MTASEGCSSLLDFPQCNFNIFCTFLKEIRSGRMSCVSSNEQKKKNIMHSWTLSTPHVHTILENSESLQTMAIRKMCKFHNKKAQVSWYGQMVVVCINDINIDTKYEIFCFEERHPLNTMPPKYTHSPYVIYSSGNMTQYYNQCLSRSIIIHVLNTELCSMLPFSKRNIR